MLLTFDPARLGVVSPRPWTRGGGSECQSGCRLVVGGAIAMLPEDHHRVWPTRLKDQPHGPLPASLSNRGGSGAAWATR